MIRLWITASIMLFAICLFISCGNEQEDKTTKTEATESPKMFFAQRMAVAAPGTISTAASIEFGKKIGGTINADLCAAGAGICGAGAGSSFVSEKPHTISIGPNGFFQIKVSLDAINAENDMFKTLLTEVAGQEGSRGGIIQFENDFSFPRNLLDTIQCRSEINITTDVPIHVQHSPSEPGYVILTPVGAVANNHCVILFEGDSVELKAKYIDIGAWGNTGEVPGEVMSAYSKYTQMDENTISLDLFFNVNSVSPDRRAIFPPDSELSSICEEPFDIETGYDFNIQDPSTPGLFESLSLPSDREWVINSGSYSFEGYNNGWVSINFILHAKLE